MFVSSRRVCAVFVSSRLLLVLVLFLHLKV